MTPYLYRYRFKFAGAEVREDKLIAYLDELKQAAQTGSLQSQARYARELQVLQGFFRQSLEDKGIQIDNFNTWLLKAAQNGDNFSSYNLGSNLLVGRQCSTEPDKALYWLEQSVENGLQEGYVLLGLELIYGHRLAKDTTKGLALLEEAAKAGSTHAQIELTRFYAAHPNVSLRDAEKAQMYMAMIDEDYTDRLSVLEAKAAGNAAKGEFKQAIKWQERAISEAKGLDLPVQPMELSLKMYRQKEVPVYQF